MQSLTDSLTFVTGFLDLSKFETRPGWTSIDEYLDRGRWVLSLPVPLIVFFEKGSLHEAQVLRPAEYPTRYIAFTLEDCHWRHEYERIARCLQHPAQFSDVAKDTPRYLITTYQKTEWLRHAAETNPFGTSHFAWIDFGILGIATVLRLTTEELLNAGLDKVLTQALPHDRIRLCAVEAVDPAVRSDRSLYYKQHRWPVAAGFALASIDSVVWFATKVRDEIAECLSRGVAITEEMIWGYILSHHRDRFDPYYGRWASCLPNYGGALMHHADVLRTAKSCNQMSDYSEAKRRLDFVALSLDFSDPDLWFTYWDERYLSAWYLGERDQCERSLLALIRGAEECEQKAAVVTIHASRLVSNSSFVVQPAREATFQRLDPHTYKGERIDCIVRDEFTPYMLSPLAVRYVPLRHFRPEQYETIQGEHL